MPSRSHSIAFFITAAILLAALLIPKAVLAEGEQPPVPDAPAGEVSPPAEEVQAPAPAETQEAVPEGEQPAEEVAPTEEAAPVPEDVTEVVELLAETNSVLLDAAGEAIPLASEEAAEALTASDPWFDAGGGVIVGYSSGGSCVAGVTECHSGTANPIQTAINDVRAAGKTINIEAGSYYENIQVTRSVTLQGAGQDLTFIYPAVSDPDTRAACEMASCANATNTVILVNAPTVAIFDLTVNGNNPFISSGVTVGGEDIDSHNGIVTTNLVTNFTVQDVTVKNVLTRGIQFGNGLGTIDIERNKVENVQGTDGAIGIFNRYGTGTIANNELSHVGDAIAMNWGRGVQITGNTIVDAWTGIHTDNTQGVDLISGNSMSNGKTNSYGVFVFAPYNPVSVVGNSITGFDYGLTVAGNGARDPLNTISFDGNTVESNVAGIYVTTDVWWYFTSDVSTSFTNNTFTGGQYGMWLESQGDGDPLPSYYTDGCGDDCVLSVYARDNCFSGQTEASVFYAAGELAYYNNLPAYNGVYNVDAINNWWGTTDATTLASMMSAGVLYDPWLPACPFAECAPDDEGEPKTQSSAPGMGGPLTNRVSVSGGQSVALECTAYDANALVLPSGDHVELPCPISGEAELQQDAADVLPAPLPDGMTYVSAMQWGLAPDTQAVQSVGATIGVHFAIPDGQAGQTFNILHWDNGEWQKLGGVATAAGYFEGSHAQTGLYAFVSE